MPNPQWSVYWVIMDVVKFEVLRFFVVCYSRLNGVDVHGWWLALV